MLFKTYSDLVDIVEKIKALDHQKQELEASLDVVWNKVRASVKVCDWCKGKHEDLRNGRTILVSTHYDKGTDTFVDLCTKCAKDCGFND